MECPLTCDNRVTDNLDLGPTNGFDEQRQAPGLPLESGQQKCQPTERAHPESWARSPYVNVACWKHAAESESCFCRLPATDGA